MKRPLPFVLFVLLLGIPALLILPCGRAAAPDWLSPTVEAQDNHVAWVSHCMIDMGTIKEGMTRADLLKVFTEEGGVSSRQSRQYVYRGCQYFKVDVQFEPVGDATKPDESPADKIKSISRPYLQWAISD